ncbi:MAG: transglycosylase family protein [Acidimicrobiia bacterium]|nr:transglycosylase family protein [Acidimicrobiia bacterium]
MVDHTHRSRSHIRIALAGALVGVVGLSGVGVAFAADRNSAATQRQAKAARAAVTVPIDAALVSKARVEAEEKFREAILARELENQARFYAAVSEKLRQRTNVNWDGIARCETGGNWSMQGPKFSGGVGFYNGTWTGFGGREFAPNAGMASRAEQIVVAERVYARYGLSGWGCRAYG